MKEDITLIGICLALILLSPIIIIGICCVVAVLSMVLIFDFIEWLK